MDTGALSRVGGWTVEELCAVSDVPDGLRIEVVDGNLVVTPPPSLWHQRVGGFLHHQLVQAAPPEWTVLYESWLDHGGDGRVPDLMVVATDRLQDRSARGARPQDVGLVIEIVSPSTRRTDRFAKPGEYAAAGIPLMWRVELEPELVLHSLVLTAGRYVPSTEVVGTGPAVVPWGELAVDLRALL